MNFGVIQKQLPPDLFVRLKDECLTASENTHEVLISGLSEKGVPKHFYLKENKIQLQDYSVMMAGEYFDEYKYAFSYKLKTDGKQQDGFISGNPWINYQKKTEYIPNHDHTGFFAYTIWINIPESTSFEFVYSIITGETFRERINVTKEMEGTIMMFPSKLIHCVYPFFNSDETRISISGNLHLT
jgi:hypothetical protein